MNILREKYSKNNTLTMKIHQLVSLDELRNDAVSTQPDSLSNTQTHPNTVNSPHMYSSFTSWFKTMKNIKSSFT